MNIKQFCIYFLTDGSYIHSYIGFSTNAHKRYRTHALKLKASAKRTKSFKGCYLWVVITGFPSKSKALSAEWFAKRRLNKLQIHKKMLQLPLTCPHKRLSTFFAFLLHEKFIYLRKNLTVLIRDPNKVWSSDISSHYKVEVQNLQAPFCPDHLK